MQGIVLIGVDVEVEVSLQSYTILVIGSHCPVGILAGEWGQETLVEELSSAVAHSIVDPGISVGVLEDLRSSIGTLLPGILPRKEGRGDGLRIDRTSGLPLTILVVLGLPRATAIHHLVGSPLVIDLTDGEEDLVLV